MKRKITLYSLVVSLFMLMNCSDNSTEPEPVDLSILTPVGGDIWFLNGDVDITWASEHAGEIIKIELSRDNGDSWEPLTDTSNNGSFTWTVTGPVSESVLIRLTDVESGANAVVDAPVQIKSLGNLDINFYLEYVYDPYPTYQTVIWLENADGLFVTSLFVSDWLARGGFNSRYVCPSWSEKANWTDDDMEEIDGITGATPEWGVDSDYSFELSERGIAPGLYKFNIETHITDEYNILYTGDFELTGTGSAVAPEPVYTPEEHSVAGQVLKNVSMKYIFSDE